MIIREWRHYIFILLLVGVFAPVGELYAKQKPVENVSVTLLNESSTVLYYETIIPEWMRSGGNYSIKCTSSAGQGIGRGGSCQATIPVKGTSYGYNGGGYVLFHNQTYSKSVKIFFHTYSKAFSHVNKCQLFVNGTQVKTCQAPVRLDDGSTLLFEVIVTDANL